MAWTMVQSVQRLVAAAGPHPVDLATPGGRVVQDPAREEFAAALRLSPMSMGNHLGFSRSVAAHPEVLGLLEIGGLSIRAARVIVEETRALSVEQAAELVAEICSRVQANLASPVRAWTATDIGRKTRALKLRLFGGQPEVRRRALADRKVSVYPVDGVGMADLVAHLDQTDAHRIHRRLSAIAHGLRSDLASCGDTRTQDQLRADILVDVLLGRANPPVAPADEPGDPEPARSHQASQGDASRPAGDPPTANPSPPEINVIVSLETLLGLVDDPGQIPGLGPIPASLARELAADGRWRAWVKDAGGAIRATGTVGYHPTAAIARAVRAREPHCRFPGCRQPAHRCDLDHTVPYPRGATSVPNLGPLCRRHHVLKTHTGWDITLHQAQGANPSSQPADLRDGLPGGPGPREVGHGAQAVASCAHGRDGSSSGEGRRPITIPAPRAPRAAGSAPSPVPRPSAGSLGWSWRSPNGFLLADQPGPALE